MKGACVHFVAACVAHLSTQPLVCVSGVCVYESVWGVHSVWCYVSGPPQYAAACLCINSAVC